MSNRTIAPALVAQVTGPLFSPVVLAMLTFRSGVQYCWSGIGPLVYDGKTYLGIGSFGQVGMITEGVEVNAAGTSVTLSGIDPAMLGECLIDIQLGASAKVWFGAMTAGAVVPYPYLVFSGTVDKPTISYGVETISITLALENRLVNLQRASNRRYTAADQQHFYPDDSAFNWVEALNDQNLRWGM